MASFNRIILVGNLTRDPELKQVPSGQLCNLGVASSRQFKNKQTGVMTQEVCFVDVDVWGAQAATAHQYLQKGRPVLIEGRLKFDMWEDAEGRKRSKHSITAERVVFLSSGQGAELASAEGLMEEDKGGSADVMQSKMPKRAAKTSAAATSTVIFEDQAPFEDDLPF